MDEIQYTWGLEEEDKELTIITKQEGEKELTMHCHLSISLPGNRRA